MRKKIAAANWKMNKTLQEANMLLDQLDALDPMLDENHIAVFGIPFPYLTLAEEKFSHKPYYHIAAQNCSNHQSGAYTGEVSTSMLASIGALYVIIGHSERREYQQEDNALLAAKVDAALASGLTPIFCCGEALEIREAANQNHYVEQQLKESLFHLNAEQMQKVVIAYEPIWAIGTGKTASSLQAQDMHAHLRQVVAATYGADLADNTSILYGGSVKGSNAVELFSQPDVDGGLVGGASLDATDFLLIMNALQQ